jgi:4-hydroxy-2-oxoheptanedioate aldolase
MEDGERLTGTFVQSPDPGACEFLGRLGFDLLCLEGEHSAMGVETVQRLVAAADLAPVPALVRVAGNEPIAIAAALDAGAAGIVVPRIDSGADAAAAVAATRYPPQGTRGLGPSRAAGYGVRIRDYLGRANRELLLAIQVESQAAVENLDSILAVEGVDMIFVGPGDLACSLGIDDPSSPELREEVESVLERSRAAGRLTGVFTGAPDDARRWRDSGTDLVILGSDLTWLARGVEGVING